MTRHDSDPIRDASAFHLEHVHFERIFDAPAPTGMFSFEAGGQRQYGVRLCGAAVPRAGSRYAVVLAQPGNWQTVVGWRDLSTPDVHLCQTVRQAAAGHAWLAYSLLPALLVAALFAWGASAALLVLAAAIAGAAACLYRVHQSSRAIEAMLRDDAAALPAHA